jgi:hypothetical protein
MVAALVLLAQAPFAMPPSGPRPAAIEMRAYPPKSAFEPPGAVAAKTLADSTAAAPKDLLTLAEKTDYRETARYDESLALARRMEKASPWIKVVTFGKTPQGRDLFAVIVSKDRAFTPGAAKATGKAIVLLQSCIHPGEVDGKEASEMLIRDAAITKRYAPWLDRVILVNIPIFNVDGHEKFSAFNRINQDGPKEMGFRVTATRLNLNRDFMKADAPEMKAWLKFFHAWTPDFFLDNHVTDGMDFQYETTIDIAKTPEVWETVGQWVGGKYLPAVEKGMGEDGSSLGFYGGFVDRNDPSKGWRTSIYTPRLSTGYSAIQSRPGLLVETHSLKSFKTRTWGHYNVMKRSIDAVYETANELRAAVRQADDAIASLAGTGKTVHLDGRRTNESTPFTYKGVKTTAKPSEIAGGPITVYEKEPVDIPSKLFDKTETTLAIAVPLGYVIPAEWSEVIERVELHGLKYERLAKAVTIEGEGYNLYSPKFSPVPFEGRFAVDFQAAKMPVKRTFPAGSIYVPLNQRGARTAMNLLEPEAPDSLVKWGFFHSIFEQKEYFSDYIMEPIAREMAAARPDLKKEFDAKVASDAAFAKSARARLTWWFERSPYYEDDKDVYPIIRVMKKSW